MHSKPVPPTVPGLVASPPCTSPVSPSAPDTWISVAEAAALTHLSPSTIIRRIGTGTICGRILKNLPFTYDGERNYIVLLESLPKKHQLQYHINHLRPEQYCQLDLITPRQFYGDLWEKRFSQIAEIIRQATQIREECRSSSQVTHMLRALAEENGLSLSTLYRLLGKPSARETSLLYLDPLHLSKHIPKSMCLWSAEFCIALYLHEEFHYSHNDIFRELESRRGQIPCTECIHHPSNASGQEIPCQRNESCMVVPNNRRTVNRLLARIPEQVLCYRKEGVRQWRSKFGYFTLRQKPLLTNDCWIGDHHIFDLFVRVKTYVWRNDRRYEKEIAVRPVLTAWMDAATGCIVGWVISILPNSDTIAEAFIRAAAFTLDEPFHGLPLSVYTDCGKDYKSNYLESDSPEQYAGFPDDKTILNRRFNGLGVIKALGMETLHALPYHPQSKPIERAFLTIEERFISKITGWCCNDVKKRPPNFSKRLQRMLENQELMTLEDFVYKFRTEILPGYHGTLGEPTTSEELPGWLLCFESMTPIQRYEAMPKARDITPGWQILAILKLYQKADCKVHHYGIRFQNVFYKDDALAFHEGETVNILYNRVEKPLAPASVTVVCNGSFLCEAYPVEKTPMTGASPGILKSISDSQNAPVKEMKRLVDRIDHAVQAILPASARKNTHHYDFDYVADTSLDRKILDRKTQLRSQTYGPAIDHQRDSALRTDHQVLKKEIAGILDRTPATHTGSKEDPELSVPVPADTDSPKHIASESRSSRPMSRSEFDSCLDFLFGRD